MSAFFGVPVDAAYHLVYALTNLFTPVIGGLAAVAAIVLFTAVVRLIVMPLSFRALRGQAAQARIAPQVAALRKRYAAAPERFQRELSALYKREGTSMFAGFGPVLAQWPVFSVLYLLFRSPVVSGGPNRLLSRDLFGVPLGSHWLSGASVLSAHGAVFAGVFVILAAVCWLSARVARRMSAAPATPEIGGAAGTLGVVGKVLPYLTVVIAAFAPLAAGIYLVTSTAWSVAERKLFARSRPDGSGKRDPRQKTAGVRPLAGPTLGKRAN
jgi:YidC/Oxa1 family membrane protein insertase